MFEDNGNYANYDSDVKISFSLKDPPRIICPGKFRGAPLKTFAVPLSSFLTKNKIEKCHIRKHPPSKNQNGVIKDKIDL